MRLHLVLLFSYFKDQTVNPIIEKIMTKCRQKTNSTLLFCVNNACSIDVHCSWLMYERGMTSSKVKMFLSSRCYFHTD